MNRATIKKFLATLLFLSTAMVHAQTPLLNDLPLPYLEDVHAQATHASASVGKGRPLVIFLHGYGSNEEDLFGMRSQFLPDYDYLSVRAPLTLSAGSYQWFNKKGGSGAYDADQNDVANGERLLLDFIRKAVLKYHAAPGKVVLIGFSQGAIMSYQLGLRHPDSVRGIAVLSGMILPKLHAELASPKRSGHLAIFIGHGTSDQRLPYAGAVEANGLLEKLSYQPEFHSYFGMGHAVNESEMKDLKLWLAKTLAD